MQVPSESKAFQAHQPDASNMVLKEQADMQKVTWASWLCVSPFGGQVAHGITSEQISTAQR